MGAGYSSQARNSTSGDYGVSLGSQKCYYELLGVIPSATDEEVKRAYRKKALELHPDRNYGNVDSATRQFADIQAAYEVLSDPQERAWYDSHRDVILNGGNSFEQHFEHNVRVTTAADILGAFANYHGQLDYSDSERGFYTTARLFFEQLALEERESCRWQSINYQDLPGFGTASDGYEEVARLFYNTWSNFSSKKSFSWEDKFRTSEASDRRVRRMMEKENKRFRDDGIREFNEAVRALVAFVKKRDPRYVPTSRSEVDRQKALRDAAAAQAARSRAANQSKMDEQTQPEWTKIVPAVDDMFEEISEDVREEFECVVCSKNFKSEKQWQAHEKSKKHIKAVQQLRKKMNSESKVLGLDEDGEEIVPRQSVSTGENETDAAMETGAALGEVSFEPHVPYDATTTPLHLLLSGSSEVNSHSSELDECELRETVEERVLGQNHNQTSRPADVNLDIGEIPHNVAISSDSETVSPSSSKLGKAKEKRTKKAARTAKASFQSKQDEFRCVSCHAGFPSKTRLFNHIRDQNHAQLVPCTIGAKDKRAQK